MQGYDCVVMDVGGEIGGNDQTFNMLAGRSLMKSLKNKEKFVLAGKLLVDPTGRKMGKTEGNMVTLRDTAEQMYGKIMSWTDEMIGDGFELCTYVPMPEVEQIRKDLYIAKTGNPRDYKMKLAYEIVKMYHGEDNAKKAQEQFINQFQKKEVPQDIPEVKVGSDKINLVWSSRVNSS